jgi:hypothetical protein
MAVLELSDAATAAAKIGSSLAQLDAQSGRLGADFIGRQAIERLERVVLTAALRWRRRVVLGRQSGDVGITFKPFYLRVGHSLSDGIFRLIGLGRLTLLTLIVIGFAARFML